MNINKNLVLLILLIFPLWVNAQPWTAPEEAKDIAAPFLFNDESVKAGEAIYNKNCKSCHGPAGMNAPAPIKPVPIDPASETFQAQQDGEIFWKVTHGKAPMPKFQDILTEDERWQVIAYIRSFNKSYVQPPPAAQGALQGVRLQLSMTWDSVTKKIHVTAMEIGKDKQLTPFKGAPVQLSVQRLFGKMNIGEIHKTNASGVASISFPPDIPGDKDGLIEIFASVNQEGIHAKPATEKLKIGVPVQKASLYSEGKMWSHKGDGPIWLAVIYGSVVLSVWAFITYVIYSTVKMAGLGRRKNT